MYCYRCGQRLAESARHCPNCGAAIFYNEDGPVKGAAGEDCDACSQDGVARLIERAVHAAIDTLGHVDDDYSALHGLTDALDEPGMARGVARAVGLQDDALDAWCV